MLSTILMQGSAMGGEKTSGMSSIIMFGAILLVFYFFMIRPQMKKQKKLKNFRESLKEGDKVITVGGIHGKVSKIEGESVTIDAGNGTKLTIEKSAVAQEFSEKELEKK